jgi:hypothetical protein
MGAVGVSFTGSSIDEMRVTTTDNPEGNGETFSVSDIAVSVGLCHETDGQVLHRIQSEVHLSEDLEDERQRNGDRHRREVYHTVRRRSARYVHLELRFQDAAERQLRSP